MNPLQSTSIALAASMSPRHGRAEIATPRRAHSRHLGHLPYPPQNGARPRGRRLPAARRDAHSEQRPRHSRHARRTGERADFPARFPRTNRFPSSGSAWVGSSRALLTPADGSAPRARVREHRLAASRHVDGVAEQFSRVRDMRPGSAFLAEIDADVARYSATRWITIRTPVDLMILPSTSSGLPWAENHVVPVLAHPLLVLEPSRDRYGRRLARRRGQQEVGSRAASFTA